MGGILKPDPPAAVTDDATATAAVMLCTVHEKFYTKFQQLCNQARKCSLL